jgi:hypothetical protein
MKFQPGQSGNPAGRPLGSRNKATISLEEELAKRAEKAVEKIVILAGVGNAAAMRICAEWVKPGGNSRALALELPRITCAADAQAALDMVIAEFGGGTITVREFTTMLGSVDRMARVAQRIATMREEEQERYGNRRVHGIHPDMIPKAPPGWTDPYEVLSAALDRGENPWPDDPEKYAYVMGGEVLTGEPLHSPVNSDGASLPRVAGEGGSPERSAGEPGGGPSQPLDLETSNRAEGEPLYSPVNSDETPASPAERNATPVREADAVSETRAPSLPRERSERGEGGERSEPGGGKSVISDQPTVTNEEERTFDHYSLTEAAAAVDDSGSEGLYSPVNLQDDSAGAPPPPGTADAAPPSPCGGGMNALYSPVNSDASGEGSPYLTPG